MNETIVNSIDLSRITSKHRIFIDTCIWMFPPSVDFLTKVLPEALFVRKKTTKITHRVIEEVNRKMKDSKKETRERAKFASRMINLYLKAGLGEVFGEKEDPDINDKTVLYIFQKYSDRKSFCLFTRDKNLANDVHQLRNQKSVDNKEFLLFGIEEDGTPFQWDFEKNPQQNPVLFRYKNRPDYSKESKFDNSLLAKFPITVKKVNKVQTGDTVHTMEHGILSIGDKLGAGEDGSVYRLKKGVVCKIFHEQNLIPLTYKKLVEMLSLPVQIQGVNWPIDLVFTEENYFLGYVMEEAKGISLQKILKTYSTSESITLKIFPEWNRANLANLALTYLRTIEQLHDYGIVLGSVDLDHVIVKNEKNISLINTDGFQIKNFHVDRALVNFTPHEVLTQNEEMLRTKKHDYYSIAVVLFAILFPGKMPYTFQGRGADLKEEHVLAKRFEFPFYPAFIPNYEKNLWSLMWASLPFHLQQLFYETFIQDKRFPIEVWEAAIRFYKDSLINKKLPAALFISGMEDINKNKVFAKCVACKSYLHITKKEYERIIKIIPKPLCERCHKTHSIKQQSIIHQQYKVKEKKRYWTEETNFLEAISLFRNEIQSDN